MQLFLEFESSPALCKEAERNLFRGRAFVRGAQPLSPQQACQLVLIHPESGQWLPLSAVVVSLTQEPAGAELELVDFSKALMGIIQDFVEQTPALELDEVKDSEEGFVLVPTQPPEPASSRRLRESEPSESASSRRFRESEVPSSRRFRESEAPSSRSRVPSIFDRLRGLNAGQRERMARSGNLQERKTLERIYGSAVWDALLSNQGITGPEVARIAKNGTAPQPIIATIASNQAWIAKAEVRRALLSNPRLLGSHIERVLRALPQTELRQVPRQTAYPAKVRAVAERLIPKK